MKEYLSRIIAWKKKEKPNLEKKTTIKNLFQVSVQKPTTSVTNDYGIHKNISAHKSFITHQEDAK